MRRLTAAAVATGRSSCTPFWRGHQARGMRGSSTARGIRGEDAGGAARRCLHSTPPSPASTTSGVASSSNAATDTFEALRRTTPAAARAAAKNAIKPAQAKPPSSSSSKPRDPHWTDINSMLFPKSAGRLIIPSPSATDASAAESSISLDVDPNADSAVRFSSRGPVQGDDLQERIAVISACLASGDVDRAEMLFHRLSRMTTLELMKSKVMSVGLINAFVEPLLENSKQSIASGSKVTGGLFNAAESSDDGFARALEWHARIKEYGMKPDSTTFAILIRHALQNNDIAAASMLIWEMNTEGVPPEDLLRNHRFAEPEDRAPLEALLRSLKAIPAGNIPASDPMTIVENILKSVRSEMASSATSEDTPVASFASTVNLQDQLILSAIKDAADASSEQSRLEAERAEAERAEAEARIAAACPLAQKPLMGTDSLGVKILRKTLKSIGQLPKSADASEKTKRQRLLEERAMMAAIEEQEAAMEKLPENVRLMMQMPLQIMQTWHKAFVPLIRRELEAIERDTRDADMHPHLPFLKLLTPEQLSRITILEFLTPPSTHRADGIRQTAQQKPVVSMVVAIGKAIEREHNIAQMSKSKNRRFLERRDQIHQLHVNGRLYRDAIRRVVTHMAKKEDEADAKENWVPQWPHSILAKAGATLAAILLRIAKILVPHADPKNPGNDILKEEFAFSHAFAQDGIKRVGVIVYHPALIERLSTEPIQVHPRLLPMVVKPRPWITRNSGGYIHYRSSVIRVNNNAEHEVYITAADRRNMLNHVFESLDVLGSTPWRVNERVYEVVRECWNSGLGQAGLPSAQMPDPPKKPENWENLTTPQRREYWIAKEKAMNEKANAFSQRCEVNYKLEIARAFLGETIYFPHNLDFRGRAYPMVAHLNHIGDDLSRGLLLFDNAKPLGEQGLRWLKIQVANLAGHDKISMKEREIFADEHLNDIFDSADNPLTGRRWWMTAEDPWQLLATCFELTDALRSKDPKAFLSRMPIHQDGTCNGLQHYAALGGDIEGARQVNLLQSESPSDVYSAVASIVNEAIQRDALEGDCEVSKMMVGRINRKLVKQTVMTNTYGVTFIGARAQVIARMKEDPVTYPFDDKDRYRAAVHVTRLIFESLGELFNGARALQVWLNGTAKMIASSIRASDIPQLQLEDAEFFAKLGCLPSPFTYAREEVMTIGEGSNSLIIDEGDGTEDEMDSLVAAAIADQNEGQSESKLEDEHLEEQDHVDEELTAEEVEAANDFANETMTRAQTRQERNQKRTVTSADRMTSVTWTTPLGLPIVQPYRTRKLRSVSTILQMISLQDNSAPAPVNSMKQATAFPPNFIHSLDATHMMLSAIACNKAGLDFASVHDSYWTHACDVPKMNEILRDAFVRLHSTNIMSRLREEFIERFGTSHKIPTVIELPREHVAAWKQRLVDTCRQNMAKALPTNVTTKTIKVTTWIDLAIPHLPARGALDLEQVNKSEYFFH